ncbi:primase-like DNA-binding domain-containing protein [Rhodomicrobium lacus]|uniref:primase-like DNA-binding domain-containing protein n=1 Tax=Rhodomicrobium lacus TaxID=2498452 RepID=UPI000F8E6440|nr:primase-like DNA-binding domain-containing protein [Rhodomicrobium lacus]
MTRGLFVMRCIAIILAISVAILSAVMVYHGGAARAGVSPLASIVVGGVGVAMVLYSLTALFMSRQARREGRRALSRALLCGLILSEGYILFYEAAWWKAKVIIAQEQSRFQKAAAQAIAKGEIEVIENAQRVLETLKSTRDKSEVLAEIDKELARSVNLGKGMREPLAKTTAECTRTDVPAYSLCSTVLSLRMELATIEKIEKAKFVIGTRVAAPEMPIPANAGEALIAEMTGVDEKTVEHLSLMIGLLALAALRTLSFAIAFHGPENEAMSPSHASCIVSGAPIMASLPVVNPDALRLDTGETSEWGSGTNAEASPSMGSVSGDATVTRDRNGPLVAVTVESPSSDRPSKEATPAAQGACVAGVSSGTQGISRRAVPAAKDAPEGDSIAAFYRERCTPSLGSRASAHCLYAAYRVWCKARQIAPASMTMFGRSLPAYARRLKTGGRIVYLDIAVPDAPLPASPATTPTARPIVPMPAHQGATDARYRTVSASADVLTGAMAGAG